MRLLVVGANGLVGSNVVSAGEEGSWSVVGTYHSDPPEFDVDLSYLDVRDTPLFVDLLNRTAPDVVVNCAAKTDVDGCEKDDSTAFAVNGDAPAAMAEACADHSVEFCHLSTDYVFDGRTDTPYTEDDTPNPIQTYGESKLAGDRGVRKAHPNPLICRLSFVYGVHSGREELLGFPRWVGDSLREGKETPLFGDQFVSPTRAGHAANAILQLLKGAKSGTYHVSACECTTPYEFGQEVARRTDSETPRLIEGSRNDIDRVAERPRNSCLDVSRIESDLGRPQPTIETDLNAIADVL